jgi:hypothetical protein
MTVLAFRRPSREPARLHWVQCGGTGRPALEFHDRRRRRHLPAAPRRTGLLWLYELSIDMFPEDGCLRVYGIGEDGVTAMRRFASRMSTARVSASG